MHSRRARALVALTVALVLPALAQLGETTGAGASTQRATYQFGINTYATFGCTERATYRQWATTEFSQYKALKANSVAIAFPLYIDTRTSNVVYARTDCATFKYQTPPPYIVGDLINVAHGLGLKVLLRPLIDQMSLFAAGPGNWRGVLAPTNVHLWFQSYLTTLRPYLRVAQSHHVEHFALETELNSLVALPNWERAITQSKLVYKGDLVFNMSWNTPVKKVPRPGTSFGIDTYPPLAAPDDASVATLAAQWQQLPVSNKRNNYFVPDITRTVIDEIGIPAQTGVYSMPWMFGLPLDEHPFTETTQANWFAAACAFVKHSHMRGIYFWGPWLGNRAGAMLAVPTPEHADDIQPAAALAIKHCFSTP